MRDTWVGFGGRCPVQSTTAICIQTWCQVNCRGSVKSLQNTSTPCSRRLQYGHSYTTLQLRST